MQHRYECKVLTDNYLYLHTFFRIITPYVFFILKQYKSQSVIQNQYVR